MQQWEMLSIHGCSAKAAASTAHQLSQHAPSFLSLPLSSLPLADRLTLFFFRVLHALYFVRRAPDPIKLT